MFSIQGEELLWDGEVLGPKGALFLDPQEGKTLGEKDGVVHKRLPGQVDGLMVDQSDGIVIIESKKPEDLRNSHKNRRLARQIKTAIGLGDKVILLVRPVWSLFDLKGKPNYALFVDMARWQKMGVYVLPGPMMDVDLPEWLFYYKRVLGEDSSSMMKALGGTDEGRIDRKEPWYLVKSLKGLGPKQLKNMKLYYSSPWDFLIASDEELKALGIKQNVIAERRKALNGS